MLILPRDLQKVHICKECKKIISHDYCFDDYVYKFYEYDPKTKKNTLHFFCSWSCYRKYRKEKEYDKKI